MDGRRLVTKSSARCGDGWLDEGGAAARKVLGGVRAGEGDRERGRLVGLLSCWSE